ncbi:MAG: AtpZ/AtpI family protein [Proteobacteria bacterium]|nr:AtpZ/AtpI family protein [Pseudomonadota bacterium]MBU1711290.1 AtpZ/AtpI family protein [Pseudomonadota bacterium]
MERHDEFPKRVHDREKKKIESRREAKKIWFGLGMFGMVGWSVALPTVAAGFLGIWIDAHWPGRYSWTLMLIIGGLCLGCYNAWYWVQKERQELVGKHTPEKKNDE